VCITTYSSEAGNDTNSASSQQTCTLYYDNYQSSEYCEYDDGSYTSTNKTMVGDLWESISCHGDEETKSCQECVEGIDSNYDWSETCSNIVTTKADSKAPVTQEDHFYANLSEIENVVAQCEARQLSKLSNSLSISFYESPANFFIGEVTVDDVALNCETSIWFKTYMLNLGYDLGYFDGQGGQETGGPLEDDEALMELHLETVM
jgi:hypothetical protein